MDKGEQVSNTTESPFSLTIKVGSNNDLLTGRADTKEEMTQRIADLRELAAAMQGASQPTMERAVQNVQDTMLLRLSIKAEPSSRPSSTSSTTATPAATRTLEPAVTAHAS